RSVWPRIVHGNGAMDTMPLAFKLQPDAFLHRGGAILLDIDVVGKFGDLPGTRKRAPRAKQTNSKRENRDARQSPHRLELHRHRFPVGSCSFEVLPLLEAEHASQNIGRKRLNTAVEVADHGVVVTARVLNRIFRLIQRTLQLRKLLGSTKLWVSFRNSKQRLQRTGELIFGSRLVSRCSRLHRHGTIFGDVFKCALFVRSVSFYGFDEVGNQVVPALELHLDIAPGTVSAGAQLHQAVVHSDQHERDDNQNSEKDQKSHGCSPRAESGLQGDGSTPCLQVQSERKITISYARIQVMTSTKIASCIQSTKRF